MAVIINGDTGIDKITDGSIVTADFASTVPLGTKNLIINGDMRIAQRGTSVSGLTTGGYYTVDRWSTSWVNSSSTWTHSQDTDVPTGQGFANSFKILCTTSSAVGTNERLIVGQRFEGQNLQHLKKGTANAEPVTLSFWVKSNKTGTYIANLYDTDNNRSISKAYTINTANTWEKKIITYAGDTTGALDNDNAQSFTLFFGLAVGTFETSGTLQTSWGSIVATDRFVGQVNLGDAVNNYINFTAIQLETGTEATPFEHRPYDMELQRCQRYHYRVNKASLAPKAISTGGAYYSSTDCYVPIPLHVEMRSNPTLATGTVASFSIYSNNSGRACSAIVIGNATPNMVLLNCTTSAATSGHAGWLETNSGTNSYLDFTAEL